MGAQISKAAAKEETATGKSAEGAAVAPKTNGQENGDTKTNGDASVAAEEAVKADVQANGSTPTEEVPKEAEGGLANEEQASSSANADEGTPSGGEDGKQKKKLLSFKKPSFKLSGFSFKKTKKEAEEGAAVEPVEGENSAPEKPTEEPKSDCAAEGVEEAAAEEQKAADGAAEAEQKPPEAPSTDQDAEAAAAAE